MEEQVRILVVENERVIAIDIADRLNRAGYEVLPPVSSGEAAVEVCRGPFPPNMLLMDIALDGKLDGIDSAARLREIGHFPVIFVTAYSDEASISRAKAVDPYGYILKPIREQDLLITLEMALSKAKLERELVRQEQRLERILENIDTAVALVSKSGELRVVNAAFLRLADCDETSDLQGKQLHEVVAPSSFSTAKNGVVRASLRTRSNTLVPVEYFEADLGEEGKVISLTDARLREEYERELLRAAREADENARARARFLSNVSHELRTPLNSIMGMTDLALDIAEDERQREYLEIVREAGHSLLGLISSILHYTRTDSTNEPIESVSVDLLLFCEEIVEAVSALRTNSSVRVGFQLRGPLPRFVRVDRRSLRQILLSIASNAVKFTGKGNAVLSVEIDESFSYLLFRIRDEGPGIPEQELERIFEPFSRSEYDDRESERGSGVGLSIAESLAHRIGAEIRVESKVGVGSDFTVRVPVEVEEGASLVDGLAGVGSFSSVEIASDDPIFTECVSSLCALGNMSVVTATGSRSATSLESDVACDIIVVDGDREYAIERVGHLEYRPRMVLVAVDKDSDPTSVLDAIPAVLRESTRVLETPLLPTSFYALIAGYAAGGDREGYSNATLSGVATTVDSSRRSEPSPDEAHSAAHRGMPGTAPVSKRILIAEDEAVNRLVNRRVLERFGHEVETAVDGNECIRVLAEKEVDLIVMDLRMPELNGIEAARKIRAGVVPGAEDTPIVALTAYALESERAECLAVGMNGFIGKPFSSQELYDAVEQYANHPIVGGTKHPSAVDAESSRLSTSHTASNFMTILQRVSAETDRERLKRLAADVSAGRRESFSRMDASELMFRLTLACRRGDISNAHDLAEQLLKMAEVGEL